MREAIIRMKNEKSAGFIVFRRGQLGPEYLLIQNSQKFFWDFPKGLVEPDEDERRAAVRELAEEVGLSDVRAIPDFRETAEYYYTLEGEKVHKELVMFLAEAQSAEVRLSWEHSKFEWLMFDVARDLLIDSKQRLLEKANEFISSKMDALEKN